MDDKVGINAVCPGEIHTPMLEAGATRSGRAIALGENANRS
nr:hypothetical protein [Rhizobium sp. CIAT894]